VNSDLKGATVYRTIVFLSYPLMAVAVGIIWRWMYDERGGIINYALRASGLTTKPIGFLQDFDWALPAVIVAEVWQILGFYMIILLTGLQSIPQNLYEAARIDGAPAWARFFRITLPMLRPSLFLCVVIGILNSFSSFDLVYIMTNGGPGHATELLITHIYKAAFVQSKFDYAAALTVVQFGLLMILNRLPSAIVFYLIPLALLAAAIATGLGVVLGVLNVFVRDVGQTAQITLQLLFWFTPIVYPVSILPASVQRLLSVNPLYPLVTGFQDVLFLNRAPDTASLLYPAVVALVLMGLALYIFRMASPDMADVL